MPWVSRITRTGRSRPGSTRLPVVCGNEARNIRRLSPAADIGIIPAANPSHFAHLFILTILATDPCHRSFADPSPILADDVFADDPSLFTPTEGGFLRAGARRTRRRKERPKEP